MAHINLPCGCQLNECFVLAMCLSHSMELQDKKREDDKAYEQYERLMRGGQPQKGVE